MYAKLKLLLRPLTNKQTDFLLASSTRKQRLCTLYNKFTSFFFSRDWWTNLQERREVNPRQTSRASLALVLFAQRVARVELFGASQVEVWTVQKCTARIPKVHRVVSARFPMTFLFPTSSSQADILTPFIHRACAWVRTNDERRDRIGSVH